MATPFTTVFRVFLNNVQKEFSFDRLPDDYKYQLLSDFLLEARAVFRDEVVNSGDINKMDDVVDFQREVYNYTTTDTTFIQVLEPAPPVGSEFYVSFGTTGTEDFTYDEGSDTITVNNLPEGEKFIYIGAYVNGQFNQTLNIKEQEILYSGMEIPLNRNYSNDERITNMTVYGKDYGMHSQSQHMKTLDTKLLGLKRNLDNSIKEYGYQQLEDNLESLGG